MVEKEQLKELEPIQLYSVLESHMVEGIMFHNDMSDYFNFIGLHGFKRIHEYQFYEENKNRRLLCRNVLDMHNKLIPHNEELKTKENIPKEWYSYTRMDIDDNILPKLVKSGWKTYKEWEEETKQLYQDIACLFYEKGMPIDSDIVLCYAKDAQEELKEIYRMCEKLNMIGYDVVGISDMQEQIHDCYKNKLKQLKLH